MSAPITSSAPTKRGSCLCGAVRYEITGDPYTFCVCHCKNCRKSSGSAFMANTFFKQEQVVILAGEGSLRGYNDQATRTGFPLRRSFCVDCGSSVFLNPGHPDLADVVGIASGTIDDLEKEELWLPRYESYPQSKRSWLGEIKLEPEE